MSIFTGNPIEFAYSMCWSVGAEFSRRVSCTHLAPEAFIPSRISSHFFLSLTHIRFGRQNPNCKEASFESFSALDFAANILAAKNIADIAAHTIVFFIITDSLWLLKTVVLLES